jgi:exosortase
MALALAVGFTVFLYGWHGNAEDVWQYGHSAFRWWWSQTRWSGDNGHARLIPFVCLWLAWRRHAELAAASRAPDWRGAALAALAMLVYWAGVQGQQVQIALYSLGILAWAVTLGFWGSAVTRLVAFPLAYLFLAFPIGFLYSLTFPLRLFSTSIAAAILNGFGLAVIRSGTAIHDAAGAFHLEVADPCSGIRSVTALVAVTALYAYLTLRGYKRWLLVASSLPLAMLGNAIRIVMVAVVARFWGQETATGFYHDFSGYVFFVVSTLLMLGVGSLLERLPGRRDGEAGSPAIPAEAGSPRPGSWITQAGIPAVLSVAAIWVVVRPGLLMPDTLPLRTELPLSADSLAGRRMLHCQNENCLRMFEERSVSEAGVCPACTGKVDAVSLAEHRLLPADTRIVSRTYGRAPDRSYSVTVVFAGEDRRSIHRPDHCLPSQGYSIERTRRQRLVLEGGTSLDVAILTARRAGTEQRIGFVYWFTGGGHETASHPARHFWMATDRLFRNTASRWAYVSILTSEPLDDPAALESFRRFLAALYHALLPR